MADERREARRHKSFLRGSVFVSKDRGALGCLIRDLSDKGARIIFSDTVMLPAVVDLFIPQRNETVRARVQWRRNDEVGLAFIAPEQPADAAAAAAPSEAAETAAPTAREVIARMAMLETEIVALRDMLRRFQRAGFDADEAGDVDKRRTASKRE